MTRRTALALATSVALSAAGATFAVGTTLGLFGAAHTSGPTGQLNPVADSPAEPGERRVETVYVDVTATPSPGADAESATVPTGPAATPPEQVVEEVVVVDDAPSPAPAYSGDDSHDDEHEDDGVEVEHEDDEHESDD